ncbi:hypothetical protein, partial [Lichenibacterium minor]|uniref:hypothetical protein n=1 Tax=Lichenibacterium minor TaxID=2316528 RepID=UPI001A91D005
MLPNDNEHRSGHAGELDDQGNIVTVVIRQRETHCRYDKLSRHISDGAFQDRSVDKATKNKNSCNESHQGWKRSLSAFEHQPDRNRRHGDVIAHLPWAGVVSRASGSGWIFGSTTA